MAILKKLKKALASKKAVLLDLDNTLYAYDPCHRYALKKVHQFYSKNIEKSSFVQFKKKYDAARQVIHRRLHGQASSHSRVHYFQIMLEDTGSVSLAADLDEFYWDSFFKKMKLVSWALPLFNFCRSERKKIVVVTNLTTALQMRKLRFLKLDKKVAALVTSEQAGVEKPNPRIFRLALQTAGVSAKEALVVGDDSKSDRVAFIDCFKI